jgi:hypothetical protein
MKGPADLRLKTGKTLSRKARGFDVPIIFSMPRHPLCYFDGGLPDPIGESHSKSSHSLEAISR